MTRGNPYHEPAGTEHGGEFATAVGAARSAAGLGMSTREGMGNRPFPEVQLYKDPDVSDNSLEVDRSILTKGNPYESKFTNGYHEFEEVYTEGAWDPESHNKPTMWRGMSSYEMDSILKTKEIQSSGAMSFHDQIGNTFYDDHPSKMYMQDNMQPKVVKHIQSILPNYPAPKLGDVVYAVEVRKPVDLSMNRQREFFTTHATSASFIVRVLEARPAVRDRYDGRFSVFGYRDVTAEFEKILRRFE